MTNEKIDEVVSAIEFLAKLASAVDPDPRVEIAIMGINAFVKFEAHKLKAGLADGSIVPDGHGGFVPATNSRYDPTTGRFL
ncbi:MAG: hypothetical protein C5B60_10285 [Chloroflexi bacterium]|nr:MAG: hypothetical protein C5B60_10285 [Chloroflexota bacterium]